MAVTNDFTASELDFNGVTGINGPTALVWGPDGRLYVTEQTGNVKVLTVAFGDKDPGDGDPTANFYVTDAETVGLVKSIPNFNDNGTSSGSNNRQVTGIDVTRQFDGNGDPVTIDGKPAVVMYVTSSDSRIGAGGGGNDAGLDTNSGMITKLVQTASGWDAIDLVRGLARSEENHATNGLEVIQEIVGGKLVSERMIVASGGNANTGAPSNNFAGQQETPYSAAILEVDLSELAGMPVKTDAASGRQYIYDLPTLNDPTRAGDPDNNDPFGGNDGLNSGKLIGTGPVQIYSAGYRNAFDIEVTDDGRVFTYDNGANNSWGGRPAGEDEDGDTNSTEAENTAVNNGLPAGYVATNLFVEDNNEIFGDFNPQNWDQLHEVTRSDDLNGRSLSAGQGGATLYSWDHPDFDQPLQLVYGGHPNPTRAEGARAGILYTPNAGVGNAKLMVSNLEKAGGSSDFLEVVTWLSSIGYTDAFINATVVAVDPGVRYSDVFASGFGGAAGRPQAPGVFSLVESATGPIGLPSDIDEIVHTVNAIEGNYLEAGYTDGALDTGKGSINGLTEYTSTILDGNGVTMKGALFASSLNQGQYYIIGRDGAGVVQTTTEGGRTIAGDREFISAGGGPLGLASIGDDLTAFGGQKAFQGSVWGVIYGQEGPAIKILQPGNPDDNALLPVYAGQEPSDPTDNDLDGVNHINDPFDFDADNGVALAAGAKIELNFTKVASVDADFRDTIGDTGLLGAALDGMTPNRDAKTGTFDDNGDGVPDEGVGDGFPQEFQEDGLFDIAGNIIPGGNAPILQIKSVRPGTAIGTTADGGNTLRDGLHTGVKIADDVQRLVSEVEIFNWVEGQFSGEGRVTGLTFGDGTQFNFVRFVFGDVGTPGGAPGLEVGIEIADVYSVLATVDDQAFIDALTVGDPAALATKKVTLQLEIADIGGDYDILARYKVDGQSGFTDVSLNATLPAGVLRDVLDGNHTISDGDTTANSGAAIGIVAEKGSAGTFTAVNIDVIRVEAFGNEIAADTAAGVGAGGSAGTDTVVYTGTDTALAALAADVENFDGSGSSADYTVTGNALSNTITVGPGANTVITGGGSDVVRGTLADLGGDTITDFSRADAVLIEGFSTADISGQVGYSGAASAVVTINGQAITFDGPDFADFDAADGSAFFDFENTVDGLRITSRAPLSPVIAINAGGAGGSEQTGTLRDTVLTFFGDGGGTSEGPGFTTTGANKAYTNATAAALDFPGTDLDDILESERSNAGEFGYSIPVPDGTYLIDFIFAEIYHGLVTAGDGSGSRQMDVDVEGTLVFDDLDVAAEAGGAGKLLVKSYQVTVTDGAIDIDISGVKDQGKLSGLVVWSTGGSFVPVDAVAPVVESITLENPQSVQDGTRTATIVVTDETGFAADAFNGLTGANLQVGGIAPDAVDYTGATLSGDGRTATLTFEITGEDNAWLNGTAGTLSLAAGTFDDAAGNGSPAASAGFVIQSNLGDLDRGAVVRAINIGTTAAQSGDLAFDNVSGEDDDLAYGGAIAADSLIRDAFGNAVAFEADSDAYHTSPKGNQNSNIDGKFGATGSNVAGIDLDGSAYHTYRDSNAPSWTSTFDGFANGTYVVELHFAELFQGDAAGQNGAGKRVGDFTVNGAVFGDNYDAFAAGAALNGSAVGSDTPSVIRQAVTVTDGTIKVLVDDISAGQAGYSAIVVYEAVDPNLPPSLSVGDVTVAEGETATITIMRTGDLSENNTVDVVLSFDGSADAADTGALSAGQVTFAPGANTATLTLPIADDDVEEGAETLSVTLSNASGSAVIVDGTATITIAASDSDLQVETGSAIFDLDFETGSDPLADGGFDGALGGGGTIVPGDARIENGKLIVQTADGDISQGGGIASKNDFTKSVDLSDPALTEVFLTTSFANPFTQALLEGQGIFNGQVPQYAQQGVVIGTGTQAAGEQVKLVFGGVAGGANPTGVQVWTKGSGSPSQSATLEQMMGAGADLFAIATVEMSLEIDKMAGTTSQYVTFLDAAGNVLGGTRPVDTAGFFTMAPLATPQAVLANINDASADTQAGVTSNDYLSLNSFEASWDFLRLSSPQFVAAPDGPPADSVNGVAVADGDFSDDRLAPTELGTLAEGETVIVATQQGDSAPGGRERDYFTFTVEEGQQLTGIVLEGWDTAETGTPQAFIGLNDTDTMPTDPDTFAGADQMLGGYVYNSGDVANGVNQDGNLIDDLSDGDEQGVEFRDADGDGQGDGFTPPLPAGTYTIWLNQGGASSTATLRLVTAPVLAEAVVIAIADADPVMEGDGATLAFGLTATDGYTGEMLVEFTQGGTPSTQTVAFDNGAGVLTIPVVNDDVANGDDTVSITLTGGTATGETIGISTDAGTAVGLVTEDDIMDPTLDKGDLVLAINAGNGGAVAADPILGIAFKADEQSTTGAKFYTDGGAGSDTTGNNPAFDGSIYETERFDKIVTYTLTKAGDGTPLVDGTQYVLELYFTELFQNAANKRIFDVTLNGALIEDNLDIVAKVGVDDQATAEVEGLYTIQTLATVVGGAITIEMNANANPIGMDNAKINGLALFEAPSDPTAVTVSVADVAASEADGSVELTFERTGNLGEAVEITFTLTDGTAVAGDDYTAPGVSTVTIAANETSAMLTVALTDDAIAEVEEAFTVTITGATSTGAGTITGIGASGTVTISDDDAPALPVGTAPGEDLDGDGIANSDDPDVDGDGTPNENETFSYDATNAGTALAAGQSVSFDFGTDGTPFQNGLTGALVSPKAAVSEINLGNASVSGGTLNVTATNGDHFSNNNTQQNALVAAFSAAEGLKVETRFAAPDFDPVADGQQSPLNFQAAGLVFGTNQNDLVKVVYGRAANEFELTTDTGGAVTKAGPAAADYGTISDIRLVLELVISDTDPATVSVKATGTLYGADDLPLAGFDGIAIGTIPAPAALATLVLAGAPIGTGVIQTSTAGSNGRDGFDVSYQYLTVTANGELENVAPTVELIPVLTELPEDADVTAAIKVADITVTDDGAGDNVLALDGTDAASFEIVGTELFLKAGTALDFETLAQLDVTVTVDDATVGATPDATAGFSLAVTDVNEAPSVTVTPVLTEIAEDADTSAATVIATIAVTDDALGTNALTLTGTDADLFEIVGTDLILKAGIALDFETKASFDVSVVLDDAEIGAEAEATIPLTLTVTDVTERTETTDQPGNLPDDGGATDEEDIVVYTGSEEVGTSAAPYALPGGFDSFDASGAAGTVNIRGNAGDNVIRLGVGADDTVDLTDGGADTVSGTAAALDGTTITGLGVDDRIVVSGGGAVAGVVNGSTVIGVDTDGDGIADSTITLAETINPSRVQSETVDGNLVLSIAPIAPNAPPVVALPILDQTPQEDSVYSFVIPAGTFGDDKGEANLTLTATLADDKDLPAWLSFDADTRTFAGTPDQNEVNVGPLSITVTATDAEGGSVSDTFELTVTNVNDAPVAVADDGRAFKGLSASFTAAQLLANDTDQDGDALTVTAVGNAVNGTVELIAGVAVFTPAASFSGPATFEYTVFDGQLTATGTVMVDVVDGAPSAATDVAITAARLSGYSNQDAAPGAFTLSGDGSTIEITGNSWKSLALDAPLQIVDGTKLRFTFSSTDLSEINAIGLETNNSLTAGTPQLFFGLAGSQVVDGSFKAVTSRVDPLYEVGDGPVTYEIDLSPYKGQSYTSLVFVNDADQQTGNGTFANVQFVQPMVVNVAPVATDDGGFTVQPGNSLSLTPASLLANDSDEDGDQLTLTSVGNAQGGTVEIDAATGLVVFTPADGATGAASFDYTISDGAGGVDTGSVSLTIAEGGQDAVTDVVIAKANLSSYDRQDRAPAAFEVRDGGETLALTGNTWKKLDLPGDGYVITEDTVLRFTFSSSDLGEINAIGLETDNSLSTTAQQLFFGLGGSEVKSGQFNKMTAAIEPLYETGNGARVYEIDLGAYAGQSYDFLVFVSDADNESTSSVFSKVQFVESGAGGAGNAAPVAGDDAFSVVENGILSLAPGELLANDVDGDEGDVLSVASVSNAVGGTVAIDGAGRVVFTPAADTAGPASFEYVVADGKGGTDTGRVDVTVVPEGTGETVTEIDFALTPLLSYGGQDARPGAGAAVGGGGSSLELSGNVWKSLGLSDYEVTEDTALRFDLTVSQLGEIHAIGLDDDNVLTNGGAFFQLFGTQTLKVGDQTYRGEYTGIGDTVSYEIDLSAFDGRTFDRMVFVNDHDGAPRDAMETFANVRLVEKLGGGGTSQAPFIVGGAIDDLALTEDARFEFALPILDNDSAFELSFVGLPSFVEVDGTTLMGTPLGADVGTYTVTVTATDADFNQVSDTFDITVADVNDAPVAAAATLPSANGFLNSGLSIDLPLGFFSDEDAGDVLAYSLVGESAGLTIDESTGEISGAPDVAGAVALTVRATDLAGAFAEAVLTLDVAAGPPREAVLIEAENFTGLGAAGSNFFTEVSGNASGNRLIRLAPNSQGEIETDLGAGGAVPGLYDLSITYYDENDGQAELTVLIDNGDGPVEVGFKVFDATGLPGQGSSLQTGNIQTLVIPGVDVGAGARLILRGTSDGDLVRIDKVELDPVDNAAPVLAAMANVTVAENTAQVTTVTATDPEGQDIAYAISGGADKALFQIDGTTGELSFIAAPDFEVPGDLGGDNVYDVIVSASDGAVASQQSVTVTVTDENAAPSVTLTSALSEIAEDADTSAPIKVADITITDDAEGTSTLALTGADADLFEIVGTAADGAALFLKAGTTLDLSANPSLDVSVTVDDAAIGDAAEDQADLSVSVTEAGAPSLDPVPLLRINAFGPQVAATDGGPVWMADGNGSPNSTYLITTNDRGDVQGYSGDAAAVPDDVPVGVLNTARSSNAPFSYSIPVGDLAGNGTYTVKLYLAELFSGNQEVGERVFDIGIEGVTTGVLDNFDPSSPNGGGDLKVVSYDVTVTDGFLNIAFAQDAVDGKDNPIVNAIEILSNPAAGQDTVAPTAAITLTNPADADAALIVGIALSDTSGIDASTLGAEDLALTVNGFTVADALITFDGFAGGVASYSIAAPNGGWTDNLDVSVTLKAGEVADLAAAPNTNAATSQSITLDIGGGTVDPGGDENVVVYRINGGGATVAAIDGGPAWAGDSIATPNQYLAFTDNRADTGGTATSTFAGVPDAIFSTARSSDFNFSYDIPTSALDGNGNYEVRLYFSEIFSGGQTGGFRTFDATVEGTVPAAFDNIDPGALFDAGTGVLTTQVAVTDGQLNLGFLTGLNSGTGGKQNPIVNGIEIVKLSGDIDTPPPPPPPVDPTDAIAILQAAQNVDLDGDSSGAGSVELRIMETANNVQSSNFGSGSFVLENTGGKEVAAVFMDFRDALYRDSIVDFDGSAGDLAFKRFAVNSGDGATGGYFDNSNAETYFLQGTDPVPVRSAGSVTSAGGYRGLLVKFDGAGNGFQGGETVTFAGDMDPNSVAAISKSPLDTGAINGWDVGGVSGAELIGSSFTVMFDDGTFATGYLGGNGNQAASIGTAVQGQVAKSAGVTVNGAGSSQTGTYGGTVPEIVVTGDVGDTIRVTLSRGLNPVTNTTDGIAGDVAERLLNSHPEFQASNAADFQFVDVTIPAGGSVTLGANAFDWTGPKGGQNFSGSAFTNGFATAPAVVGVAVIDAGSQMPLGATDRVYLTNQGGPVTGEGSSGGGTPGTGAEGYFEIIGGNRFKIQIEDENANGGQNPGGKWSFENAPDSDGAQAGFQGDGYYLFGGEANTSINGVNANEVLEYTVFIPDANVGTFNFRLRASRDGDAAGDQQNDIWLNFKKDGTAESIEDYLIEGNNEPEPTSQGFIKIFGGPNNGTWGTAANWDGLPNNPSTQLSVTEGGLYTVQIAGRSQGFHVDSFELFKGGAPGAGASNSAFVAGDPGDTGGGGGTPPPAGDLVIPIDASADDWEERGGATSGDFEIGENGGPQWAALRFDGIDIPDGAVIERAFIRFEADGNQTGPASFSIAIQNGTDVAGYSAASLPVNRSYAADEFQWSNVPGWQDGQSYDTPDISALIEAVIGAGGVVDGELGFFFEGSGKRAAVAFDGDGAAPELHIQFADDNIA